MYMCWVYRCLCKDRIMISHVYVLGVSMVPLFTNLLLDLGNVLFLKVEVKAHTRSLTPPFVFIEVSLQRQGNEQSCICVRCIDCTSFYEFNVVFRKCSDSVLCLFFILFQQLQSQHQVICM